ncbi:MAG TPA: 4a-hydroxytetrahydrobiopterin dehydratase [Acidimicrobiales bacterium]|nr:4a-hydroxytetrahydrobiopterin dehydratase [Acidimicrobiales bacterium]
MATVLSDDEITKRLAALPGWACVEGRLHKELKFRDFNEAFGFMARVALVAEKRDHHPDWSNSWNTVVVGVVNHAAGGVTDACVQLCIDIEAIAREMVEPDITPA